MKKILIKYYCNLNLGDDLFIKILTERYSHIHFIIKNEGEMKVSFGKNLEKVSYNKFLIKLRNLLRKLNLFDDIIEYILSKKVNGIVQIGGSIFIEDKWHYRALKDYHKYSRKIKKYWYILGCNFGPYKEKKFKEMYYQHFSECCDICFREKYSYNLFKDLPNTRYAKDIVFGLNIEQYNKKEYILISVIKPSIRKELIEKDEEYYRKISELSIDFIEKNKKVKLISFCKNEGDEEAIEKILSFIPKEYSENISSYSYRGNIDEILEIIGKSEIVIATRFHAMILGFIFRKKVYPIAYSDKTINVLKDLEFKGNFCSFDNLKDISYEKILENEVLDEEIIEEAKRDAERHFEKLDLFLNKK